MPDPQRPTSTPMEAPESDRLADAARAITPARILAGRVGPAYCTATQLRLRADHAAAVDAVRAEFEPREAWGTEFCARWEIVVAQSAASSKQEYLLRPDLGRRLSVASRESLARECPRDVDLQIAIGDGLSAAAVTEQVPKLLPILMERAIQRGMRCGRVVFVRYARVGLLNDLGEVLRPNVVVLLIGERPGLATAESLSAYLAFQPRPGDTDARRNLISNIHSRGVSTEEAAVRILALAGKLMALQRSGVDVKEDWSAPTSGLTDDTRAESSQYLRIAPSESPCLPPRSDSSHPD